MLLIWFIYAIIAGQVMTVFLVPRARLTHREVKAIPAAKASVGNLRAWNRIYDDSITKGDDPDEACKKADYCAYTKQGRRESGRRAFFGPKIYNITEYLTTDRGMTKTEAFYYILAHKDALGLGDMTSKSAGTVAAAYYRQLRKEQGLENHEVI